MEKIKTFNNIENSSHFLSFVYLPYDEISIPYLKNAIRLPIINDINLNDHEILNDIFNIWTTDKCWNLIFDKRVTFELNGISIDYGVVLNGLIENGDWDYVFKNSEIFNNLGFDIDVLEIFKGLKIKEDWDSILANIYMFNTYTSVEEIYKGLCHTKHWFSIINSEPFFNKNDIELNLFEVLNGLKLKGDWNTIFSFRESFKKDNINLDYLEIFDGLISNNELSFIFENQNEFIKEGVSMYVEDIYNDLYNKSDLENIIKNRFYFEKYNIPIDLKYVYDIAVKTKDWLFIVKHSGLFISTTGVTIEKQVVEELYNNIPDVSELFIEQRYDLLCLFYKHNLINLNPDSLSDLKKGLSEDGRIRMLDSIDYILNGDILKPKEVANKYEIESKRYDINLEIVEFYSLQLLNADLFAIKYVPDYSYKLESEHLIFINHLEKLKKAINHRIKKILREHLLFVTLERVRRSKIESNAKFEILNLESILKTKNTGEIRDLFASIIGLFCYNQIDTPWIQIAYAGYNIWSDKEISDSLLDYIFSLEHNNGSVFTRGNKIKIDELQCKKILDIKKSAKNLDDFLNQINAENIPINVELRMLKMLDAIKKRLEVNS